MSDWFKIEAADLPNPVLNSAATVAISLYPTNATSDEISVASNVVPSEEVNRMDLHCEILALVHHAKQLCAGTTS